MYPAAITLLQVLPNLFLCLLLLRNRLRFSLATTLLIASLLLALGSAGIAALYVLPHPIANWRLYFAIFYLLLCVALYLYLARGTLWQNLFNVFVIEGYADNLLALTKLIHASFFTALPPLESYFFAQSIAVAASFPLMYFITIKVLRPIAEADSRLPFWRYLWLLPVSFFIIFRISIFPSNLTPLAEEAVAPSIALLCTWVFLTLLSHYVVLRMLHEMMRKGELQEQLHLSALELSIRKKQYETLRRSIDETARARHDLRHFLLGLRAHVKARDCQSIQGYVNDFLSTAAPEEPAALCENAAVNAVLRHYAAMAREYGVRTSFSLDIPRHFPIQESDFCLMLECLFENAIEACARQKNARPLIRLSAKTGGKQILALTFINNFSHEIHRDGEVFLSAKRDGVGTGIAFVRALAAKYHGLTKFSYADGLFHASVLLPLPHSARQEGAAALSPKTEEDA